ncbi:Protein ESC2 [Nakaseomyces bracarensis]|uniref:Protein ESC2 n=1 Tax=Nakaseomyces bracarensis TaxID=273131 RepID=A0ABR4P0L9_9SACH
MDSDEDSDDFFMEKEVYDEDERIKQALEDKRGSEEPPKAHAQAQAQDQAQAKQAPQEEARQAKQTSEEEDSVGEEDEGSSVGGEDESSTEEVTERQTRKGRRRSARLNADVVVLDYDDNEDVEPLNKRTRSSVQEPDENDIFFQSLAKRSKSLPSVARETAESRSQDDRVYYVQFISRIDGTRGKSLQVKALGRHEFNKLVTAALSGFMKTYGLPSVMKPLYTAENTVLYWNKVKLLGFMTCNSLKIPQRYENEVCYLEVKVIPKDQEDEFIEAELQSLQGEPQDETKTKKTQDETKTQIEEFEKELRDDIAPQDIINIEDAPNVMRVALVGQDNKKIVVNVRPSTVFDKLIQYYRIQKQLPQRARITLVFDDEELNPHQTVASQQMEDEDMIEVRVAL